MIIIIKCEECNKEIHFDNDKCDRCSSKNLLKYEKGKYYFQGQVFSRNNWYRKMGNYLNFDNDTVSLRRTPDEIRIGYVKAFILKNIKKATFLRLILPCAVILALSLVLLWAGHYLEENSNLLNVNQFIFMLFLGGMFFLIGSILLVKIIIFQEKVIMLGTNKRTKVRHISKSQYQGIIDVFQKE